MGIGDYLASMGGKVADFAGGALKAADTGFGDNPLQRMALAKQLQEAGGDVEAGALERGLSAFAGTLAGNNNGKKLAEILQSGDKDKLIGMFLESGDPEYQKQGLALALKAQEKQGPMKIGAGETLYDPNTGKALFTGPEKGMTPYQQEMLKIRQQQLGGMTPYQQAMLGLKEKEINVMGGLGRPPSGYMINADGTGFQPIPGGPKDASAQPLQFGPGDAAKASALRQGYADVKRFKSMAIKDGKPNRTLLAQMSPSNFWGGEGAPVPGTDGGEAYSLIYNSVESKMRAESGAAVPEPEVARMAKRFIPKATDNDATINSKLQRLDEYLGSTLDLVDPRLRQQGDQMYQNTNPAPTAPTPQQAAPVQGVKRLKFNPQTGNLE